MKGTGEEEKREGRENIKKFPVIASFRLSFDLLSHALLRNGKVQSRKKKSKHKFTYNRDRMENVHGEKFFLSDCPIYSFLPI